MDESRADPIDVKSTITMIPIETLAGNGESAKLTDTGKMQFKANQIDASGDDFWAVMVAAKRRGISFTDYIWQAAVTKARSEV